MIGNIIDLLGVDDFYGESELIDIAKGKYKAPETWKETFYNTKRRIKWQLRKR